MTLVAGAGPIETGSPFAAECRVDGLSSLRPGDLQRLVKALDAELAPATVNVIYSWVGAILKAAAADRMIPASPSVGIKLPMITRPQVKPLEAETVAALAERIDARRSVDGVTVSRPVGGIL